MNNVLTQAETTNQKETKSETLDKTGTWCLIKISLIREIWALNWTPHFKMSKWCRTSGNDTNAGWSTESLAHFGLQPEKFHCFEQTIRLYVWIHVRRGALKKVPAQFWYECNKVRGSDTVYLWDIPMITLSTPLWLDMSMMVLSAGMSDSQPSRPNRFSEDHFLWRNSSNLWTGGGAAASPCGSE